MSVETRISAGIAETTAVRFAVITPSVIRIVRSPRQTPEARVDAVLRVLWQLVGVYVWLVLVAKRERPGRRGALSARSRGPAGAGTLPG